jgi:hypothetical protein
MYEPDKSQSLAAAAREFQSSKLAAELQVPFIRVASPQHALPVHAHVSFARAKSSSKRFKLFQHIFLNRLFSTLWNQFFLNLLFFSSLQNVLRQRALDRPNWLNEWWEEHM